ncbi:MAG: hypothetical protein V1770_02065 [bacterium]
MNFNISAKRSVPPFSKGGREDFSETRTGILKCLWQCALNKKKQVAGHANKDQMDLVKRYDKKFGKAEAGSGC